MMDCQNEKSYRELAAPRDDDGFWLDEYGEPHPRVRRWHPVRAFALALLESLVLFAAMAAIILGVPAIWALLSAMWVGMP